MDDPRYEPGMPVLDRQVVREPVLPPSLRGLPPRSVPELRPTPLQKHYINLSVVALICGAIAITALEIGVPLGSPLVKLCVLVGAPLLFLDDRRRGAPDLALGLGVDARRTRDGGLFRLAWFAVDGPRCSPSCVARDAGLVLTA